MEHRIRLFVLWWSAVVAATAFALLAGCLAAPPSAAGGGAIPTTVNPSVFGTPPVPSPAPAPAPPPPPKPDPKNQWILPHEKVDTSNVKTEPGKVVDKAAELKKMPKAASAPKAP